MICIGCTQPIKMIEPVPHDCRVSYQDRYYDYE
jgi:hypothetical protein